MPGSNTAQSARRRTLTHGTIAFVAVISAAAVRELLNPLLASHAGLLLFTVSIMVAARFGGVLPGLFATALSALFGDYYFLAPHGSLALSSPADMAYLSLFVVVGIGISLISGQLRGTKERLEHSVATLRDRTMRLEELTRTLNLGSAIVRSLDGAITYWSQGAEAMYGWPPQEAVGRSSDELLETEFPAPRAEIEQTLFAAAFWQGELRQRHRDGRTVVVASRWALQFDGAGKPRSIIEINSDISEQKRVQAELRAGEERLRALSASLISIQEQERRRVSRELHDDLVQRLGLMAIDLGKLIPQAALASPPLGDELRAAQERAVQAAELARHVAHELHPLILDDLGIVTAIRSLCEEFARREETDVVFTSGELPDALKREVASCLYAVTQEALLNAAKYARATRVEVRLSAAEKSIHLAIADDGVGFPQGAEAGSVGLGIVNMRERVRWLKGGFSLDSQPGRGTQILVVIPL